MTCNFPSLPESKMWCSLGREGHEQVRERESVAATPAHASGQDAVARCTAGGGRAPSRRDAHDGEYLERTARVGRSAGAQTPAAGSTLRLGCDAEGRIGAVAERRSAGAGICHGAVDVATCGPADRGEVRPSI